MYHDPSMLALWFIAAFGVAASLISLCIFIRERIAEQRVKRRRLAARQPHYQISVPESIEKPE